MIGALLQISTAILGSAAVIVVAQKKPWFKWGFLLGTLATPCWVALELYYHQYWLLPTNILYAYGWWVGLRNHLWRRKK